MALGKVGDMTINSTKFSAKTNRGPVKELRTKYVASVVIPTLNEENHIADILENLLAGWDESLLEIIVVDGGSSDRTRDIVGSYQSVEKRIWLIDNPKRIQAAGVNLGAAQADVRSNVIIRMDAHCRYEPTFVTDILYALEQSGADSVVVRLTTLGDNSFTRAVAYVSNKNIGTGGSRHRVGCQAGFVDHGHHAAFRREALSRVGGYNERLAANEDAELDFRLLLASYKIWLASDMKVCYFPRRSLLTLAKQYFRNGSGRAQNMLMHSSVPKIRQIVPALFTLYCVLLPPLMYTSRFTAAPLAVYLMLLLVFSVKLFVKDRDLLSSACIFGILPAMHLSWGAGFLGQCSRRKRPSGRSPSGVTRPYQLESV